MIELEEQRVIDELPQMEAVFLQAVNELKFMGLPKERASKLQNSYLIDSEATENVEEDTAVLQQPKEISQEQKDEERIPSSVMWRSTRRMRSGTMILRCLRLG